MGTTRGHYEILEVLGSGGEEKEPPFSTMFVYWCHEEPASLNHQPPLLREYSLRAVITPTAAARSLPARDIWRFKIDQLMGARVWAAVNRGSGARGTHAVVFGSAYWLECG